MLPNLSMPSDANVIWTSPDASSAGGSIDLSLVSALLVFEFRVAMADLPLVSLSI